MDSLFIKGTAHTPEINFNAVDYIFTISGRSIPEDADIYYYPVLKYLKVFKKELETTINSKNVIFEFKLLYYNSASIRYLNTVMHELETVPKTCKLKIKWYFEKDDEYLKEMGLYFQEIDNLDIELIAVDPPPRK